MHVDPSSCVNFVCVRISMHTAIECSVKLAETQLKLEALRRRYRELLASKEQMKRQLGSS